MFTGKETGEFIALDVDSGKQVWQFQTGSGINAQPITYTHDGRQYVTVLSGIGGLYLNTNRDHGHQIGRYRRGPGFRQQLLDHALGPASDTRVKEAGIEAQRDRGTVGPVEFVGGLRA